MKEELVPDAVSIHTLAFAAYDIVRYIPITANQLAVSILSRNRNILLHLKFPPEDIGLLTEIEPVVELTPVELTPTEARRIAQLLNKKADEAEDGLPRA